MAWKFVVYASRNRVVEQKAVLPAGKKPWLLGRKGQNN